MDNIHLSTPAQITRQNEQQHSWLQFMMQTYRLPNFHVPQPFPHNPMTSLPRTRRDLQEDTTRSQWAIIIMLRSASCWGENSHLLACYHAIHTHYTPNSSTQSTSVGIQRSPIKAGGVRIIKRHWLFLDKTMWIYHGMGSDGLQGRE